MRLLVDMNLPLSWIERLARDGFEAVHWSTIGAPTAADNEILSWRANGFVLLTHDLDFSAIPAATSEAAPSVVQPRMQDPAVGTRCLGDCDLLARARRGHRFGRFGFD